MTALFIHGVPDTHIVWDHVRLELPDTDTIALDLPGFGRDLPPGFLSTKEEYVDWIIAQIEALGKPVDLIGHDWGAILTVRVASLRPDLVRSWAAGNGPVDAGYVWHDNAKIWQTPGAGERWWSEVDEVAITNSLVAAGVSTNSAARTASHIDDRMKGAILKLYRSALNVGTEWEPGLASIKSPGLVYWGANDPFCSIEFGRRLSAKTHAQLLELDAGHWAPEQRPKEIAAALVALWRLTGDSGKKRLHE